MNRTAPACPASFRTPRLAGEYFLAVERDILACTAEAQEIVRAHTAEARASVLRWLERWNRSNRQLERDMAHYAVRWFAALVYGEAENRYRERDRYATFAQHVERERRAASFDGEQRAYRERVGLDPQCGARKESA